MDTLFLRVQRTLNWSKPPRRRRRSWWHAHRRRSRGEDAIVQEKASLKSQLKLESYALYDIFYWKSTATKRFQIHPLASQYRERLKISCFYRSGPITGFSHVWEQYLHFKNLVDSLDRYITVSCHINYFVQGWMWKVFSKGSPSSGSFLFFIYTFPTWSTTFWYRTATS